MATWLPSFYGGCEASPSTWSEMRTPVALADVPPVHVPMSNICKLYKLLDSSQIPSLFHSFGMSLKKKTYIRIINGFIYL